MEMSNRAKWHVHVPDVNDVYKSVIPICIGHKKFWLRPKETKLPHKNMQAYYTVNSYLFDSWGLSSQSKAALIQSNLDSRITDLDWRVEEEFKLLRDEIYKV